MRIRAHARELASARNLPDASQIVPPRTLPGNAADAPATLRATPNPVYAMPATGIKTPGHPVRLVFTFAPLM